jgi:radical SAM protein with 4Fe4S-binding SPASM domain
MSFLASLVQRLEQKRVPLGATMELTTACHLRCAHCYVTRSKKTELTTSALMRVLDQMAEAGSFYVGFTGGESALRRDLFALIAHARRRHFLVRLLTSGTKWTSRHWDKIAALGVDEVRMSLYARTPELHDQITGVSGSHARTLTTARGLMDRGVRIAFGCPVLRTNAHEVIPLFDWCSKEGIPLILDAKITWTDQDNPGPASLRPSVAQLAPLMAQPKIREILVGPEARTDKPLDTATPCRAGNDSAFIKSTGDVYPCSNWPVAAGSVHRSPLLSIWRSSPVFAAARALSNADLVSCRRCLLRRHCQPCVAMNLQERGTIAKASPGVCTTALAVDRAAATRR